MTWGTQTLWELGRSSLTVRAFLELRAKLETPTLEAYFQSLQDDYRTDTESFPRRWEKLKGELRKFYSRARSRSNGRPLFLILPIMVDFKTYPMPQVHDMLRREAEAIGYEVLDLLPEFTERLKDGTPYRVTPNDNHFNPTAHRLTAELIKQRLDARSGASSPPNK
jgi:lysophospholipase L1-like esterase